MSIQKFGLRYERLLILSAPISLACILVAFVAIASDVASEKSKAACYAAAAEFIDSNSLELNKLWEKRVTIGKKTFANEYVSEIAIKSIRKIDYKCDHKILQQDVTAAIDPAEFSKSLKNKEQQILDEIAQRPVRSYGIEIPEKSLVSFFGATIKINTITFAQVIQIVLLPILLLWFGSLFNTRYRETILIENAKSISDLYPHVINVYMNASLPELRKKSLAGYYLKKSIPYIPTIFRVFLLSIFILPPTVFYCTSLIYLDSSEHVFISASSGVLVAFFALVNLISETNPWHSGKAFPGPNFYKK